MMWCFTVSKKLRTPYNGIVLGMSLTDGLTTTIVIPMEMYQFARSFVYRELVYCRVRVFLKAFCYTSSLMFILTISVIRLLSVVRTFPPTLRFSSVGAIVSTIYIVSGLLTSLSLDERSSVFNICMGTMVQEEEFDNTIFWLIFFVLSVSMFISTILCYVLIVIILKYRGRANMATASSSTGKNDILTLKVASIVTLAFVVAYLTPYLAIILKAPFLEYLHYLALMGAFLFITSALNPIIYTFSSSTFRRAALTSLTKKCNCPPFFLNEVAPSSNSAPTQQTAA